MINFPTCKINLGLNVLKKRSDGFHEVETCMLEIPWTDILEITPAESDMFSTSGLDIPGKGNFILDALNVFRNKYPIPPLAIHLHKVLPMGGGLGGGSSDAAFALCMLHDQFHPQVSNQELEVMAAQIGSDCAFFVAGGTQFATGRGEVLKPIELSLKGYSLVLLNNGTHVSTKEAYASITPSEERESLIQILNDDLPNWKGRLKNDFEKSVFNLFPELSEIKKSLYDHGAAYAAMTGSGSTMFGIFKERVELKGLPKMDFQHWVDLS